RTARRGRHAASPGAALPPRAQSAAPPSPPPNGRPRPRSQPSHLLLLSSFRCPRGGDCPLLRVDVLERVSRVRVGAGLGELDCGVDNLMRLGVEPVPLLVAQLESLAQVLDR